MHLLAAQPGAIEDGSEPVDLGQTPADIVFVSAADTELAALSEARAEMSDAPELRLGNLAHLAHPMSVDLHLDNCATKSKLVIARVLGGRGYWTYGLEQFAARLGEAGVAFAALPGDDKPDDELWRLSTIDRTDWEALWAYLVEGGAQNATNFLAYAQAMLTDSERPEQAKPLLKSGVYWPGSGVCDLQTAQASWQSGAPVVPLVFYRALVQGAGLNPINRLTKQLLRKGLNPLPIFVASLKDPLSTATLNALFSKAPPSVILNCTAFATGSAVQGEQDREKNPFELPSANKAPVFQVILSGSTEAAWMDSLAGLSARDIAMNVSLPEVDGRVLSRAISFKGEAYFDEATECPIATYQARGDRVDFVADLAANWAKLRQTAPTERKVALILANYPNKDGRLANGVGLDTPASTVDVLKHLAAEGYNVANPPQDSDALMAQIMAGPTNWLTDRSERSGGVTLPLSEYKSAYDALPWSLREQIETRWGAPEADPFFGDDGFALSVFPFGNAVVGVQPARGYNIDPKETYHSPDLVPPHNYIAFYVWMRRSLGAHAIIHMGKHGNLEWLPGKAVSLSETCLPEAILGPTPHIYPFIVNDPGEGTQAKRRSSAVIIDHLTPPLTRAETYGPLKDLEALVDEYYEAAGVDPRRLDHLRREILSLTAATGVDQDAGFDGDEANDFAKLDNYLCDLKEAQIRDGLHVFGATPEGRLQNDLLQALTRVPRAKGEGADASLIRALSSDLDMDFDPLDTEMNTPWSGVRPAILDGLTSDTWRTAGDSIERLELLAAALFTSEINAPGPASAAVMEGVKTSLRPTLTSCGPSEIQGLTTALNGQFVPPRSLRRAHPWPS